MPAPPGQFKPRRDGTRLYARGAQDMKISALAEALAFREVAATVPYPLALQLVTDEETGGRDGTRHQITHGVRGEFVIIGETSGLRIVTETKGMLGVTLEATGRGAHSAYPWLGDNALVALNQSVSNILLRYPSPTEEEWRTTVNLARVHTPNQARNQIPAEANAWLDIRFPPEDTDLAGRSAGEIAAYLQTFCAPGVTAVVGHVDAPQFADGRPRGDRAAGRGDARPGLPAGLPAQARHRRRALLRGSRDHRGGVRRGRARPARGRRIRGDPDDRAVLPGAQPISAGSRACPDDKRVVTSYAAQSWGQTG